jgi:hypothetical protein
MYYLAFLCKAMQGKLFQMSSLRYVTHLSFFAQVKS